MTIPPTLEEPLRTMLLVGSLSTGGAERFVANVATHLDRQRFKPYLALFRDTFSYPIPDDVQVKVLRKFRPWHNIRAALRLARWIDEVRPHVLLSAWSVPNVFAAEFVALDTASADLDRKNRQQPCRSGNRTLWPVGTMELQASRRIYRCLPGTRRCLREGVCLCSEPYQCSLQLGRSFDPQRTRIRSLRLAAK